MSLGWLIYETADQRLDRLVFSGLRTIVEGGLACWCPIGKDTFVYPLPAEMTEAWWDEYLRAMIEHHAECSDRIAL